MLTVGSVYAQGIYNLTPYDTEPEAIPLEFTGSIDFGWDDNVTPTTLTNRDDSSSFLKASLESVYSQRSPQTHVDFSASVGALYYIDNIDASNADDTYYDARLDFDIAHDVSERVRLTTRNYVFYGLEPDYSFGAVNDRTNDEYFFFSTDNAIGYEWNPRLGSYTGVKFDTLAYSNDTDRNDRENFELYHQQRYVVSQQTTATLGYRLRFSEVDSGLDSDNHFVTIGAEHRISPTAVVVGSVGVQIREVDNRDSQSEPTFSLSYVNRVNEQFALRGSASYEINDYSTSFSEASTFEDNQTFRLTVYADYYVTPDFYFTGGINYINEDFTGDLLPDDDVQVLNLTIGATYKIQENLVANVNYNYTDSSDDGDTLARDYDRNRVQAGLSFKF